MLCQVTKGQQSLSFYSLPEFQEWKEATESFHTWKVKYYKGEFVLCLNLIDMGNGSGLIDLSLSCS